MVSRTANPRVARASRMALGRAAQTVSSQDAARAFGRPRRRRRWFRGRSEVSLYNHHRPHGALGGLTPAQYLPTLQASDLPTIYAMRRTLLLRCEL